MSATADRRDRRLLRESAAARPHLILAAGLGVATAACVVAQAALLARIIARAATGEVSLGALRGELLSLVAVFLIRALLAGGFDLSGRLAATRVLSELRLRVTEQLLVRAPGRMPADRTGELAATAVQGVDALEAYFSGYLPALMLSVCVPLAALIWVTPIDWVTTLIFVVTIPLLITFMILIGVTAESRTRRRWAALSLLSSHFLDVVRGLETLRAHRRELAQSRIITEVGERYRRATMGTLRIAFLSAFVLELCAMIGTGLVAATIGVQLSGGHLSLDAGLTVLLLAPELYAPLRAVGQQFHAAADGTAAAARLYEVLDAGSPPSAAVPPAEGGRPQTGTVMEPLPSRAALSFERVSYGYPGRRAPAIQDLTLTLAPGSTTAIIGASGAGKSTLAALALRLIDPTAGSMRYGNRDLSEIDPALWRRQLAWVPQRTRLFTGTLAENIALARPDADSTEIGRAADQAGLATLLAELPRGLATAVGDGGRRLSAGQAQRVALARAFLSGAPLVVLDEPTANLDRETAAAVAEAIAELAEDRTLLLITHDRQLADRVAGEHVIELRDGRAELNAEPLVAVQ